jgi:hypothetical protein
MGSVDRSDMLLSSKGSIRKNVKWYKKLFFHLLDLTVLNAHTVFNLVTEKNIPVADFQSTLIRDILEKYCKGRGRKSENLPLRLVQIHFP